MKYKVEPLYFTCDGTAKYTLKIRKYFLGIFPYWVYVEGDSWDVETDSYRPRIFNEAIEARMYYEQHIQRKGH